MKKLIFITLLLLAICKAPAQGLTGVGTDTNGEAWLLVGTNLVQFFPYEATNNPDYSNSIIRIAPTGGGGGASLIQVTNVAKYLATNGTTAFNLAAATSYQWSALVGTPSFDASGAALAATNGLGSAAFKATSYFDTSGAGNAAALAATNGLGTAAWQAIGYFDLANASKNATNTLNAPALIGTVPAAALSLANMPSTNLSGILTPVVTNIVVVGANNITNGVTFTNGTATVFVGISALNYQNPLTNTPLLTCVLGNLTIGGVGSPFYINPATFVNGSYNLNQIVCPLPQGTYSSVSWTYTGVNLLSTTNLVFHLMTNSFNTSSVKDTGLNFTNYGPALGGSNASITNFTFATPLVISSPNVFAVWAVTNTGNTTVAGNYGTIQLRGTPQ